MLDFEISLPETKMCFKYLCKCSKETLCFKLEENSPVLCKMKMGEKNYQNVFVTLQFN